MRGIKFGRLSLIILALACGLDGAAYAQALTQEQIGMLTGPDRQKILEEGAKKDE